MDHPTDPVAAVAHPDPYPYYAFLRDGPVHRDRATGLWVASRASDVAAALASADLRVRPPAEPVPRALVGTRVGEAFAGLVRMNDGPRHGAAKPAVSRALDGLALAALADASRRTAVARADAFDLARGPERVMDVAFDVPARVVAG